MAPAYRNNPQTRRGNRAGYPEHDDFEGLPTRQWRQQWVNVAPPPEVEETKKKDRWAEELPHGMPKGSENLPIHSFALLRAARSGRMHKRPVPAEDDDGEPEGLPSEKTEKKPTTSNEGFRVKAWKQVPRSEEGPTISHLAKRHKNTVTLPSKAMATTLAGPTITKATVKRVDAAGNPYTQTVTLAAGQQVDGEIISTSVVAAPEAGPTPPAAATPRRKATAAQKKKPRGRGRGRGRGRLTSMPSTRPQPQESAGAEGSLQVKAAGLGPDGIKMENDDGKGSMDVEMQDSSAIDDDDGDDGDEGDDDDGDESGTPAENEDQEMEDAPALPTSSSAADAAAIKRGGDVPEAVSHLAPPAIKLEGSPLKNVQVRSPTETTSHFPPMATGTGAGSSETPSGLNTGLQPSPMESQSQQASVPDVMDETPTEETKPAEAAAPEATAPEKNATVKDAPAEETVPEPAKEPTETAPEEAPADVPTTPTPAPDAVPAPPGSPPPPAEDTPQGASAAAEDIPIPTIPTSEETIPTGEAPEPEPEAPPAAAESEAPLVAEPPPPPTAAAEETVAAPPAAAAPLPDSAPATQQAITEDGTDDGSDILGALGARLAEDDVPGPTSAPAEEQPREPEEKREKEEQPVKEENAGEE